MSYSRSMWIATVVLQLLLLRSVAGQGLFLSLRGTPIDADGFVDVDEIGSYDYWNNPDGLLCHTNQSVRAGAWQFPNGTVTPTISDVRRDHGGIGFGRDRGPTGVLGVVRLSQLGNPSERGRFRCEIFGNTTNVNILDIGSVSTSSASTVTAGQPVTLQCSVAITPHPLPVNASTPVFEWFFGPTFNQPLTPTTNTNSGSTYTSTYSITSAMESDEGMYTCRLRGNQLTAVSTMVTVDPAQGPTASITASGTNTAGETYSLVCSVTATSEPTITWSGPMNSPVPSTTGSMSTLTFNPLSASHAGTYTCRAEAGGEMAMDTEVVTVQNPSITVSVAGVATPMAGSMYSLSCTVTGAERLTGSTITYQWFKDGVMVSGQTMETFSFTPLSFSDAGRYTCQSTVMSSLLSGPITTTRSNSMDVTLTLPTPTVSITSNPPSIITAGTTVTLTCTVELSPSVDVPVTVNTVWTGPDNFNGNIMAQQMGSTTTYTSTAMVSAFGRDQSGNYTCTATVSSTSQFIMNSMVSSPPTRVTVGVYLRQNGMVRSNNSNIMISDIGREDNNRLQCVTDRMPCCRSQSSTSTPAFGNWYFPGDGGMAVPSITSGATTFFRNRGDDGTVNLHRLNSGIMMPTGRYCCVVPDATDVLQWACVIISSITVEISDGGVTPTLGQGYTLTCTVFGTTFTSYQWRKDGTVISGETEPTLSFSSLTLTHAGGYQCGNGTLFSSDLTVELQVPSITSVTVRSSMTNPVRVGSTVTVTCEVELSAAVTMSELSVLTTTAQLTGGTASSGPTISGSTLTFSFSLGPFMRTNSDNYTCTATISSPSPFLTPPVTGQQAGMVRITTGVYLSLGGGGNNSNILITNIGEGDSDALLCYTDLTQCCQGPDLPSGMALGEWLFPNGSVVEIAMSGGDFYRNRGPSSVRLNRRNNATSPVGQFCCVVPDATFTNVTVCANLVLELPTTAPPTTNTGSTGSQGGGVSPGLVAGVIVIVIVLIIVVVIVVVVILVISRRRGSEKFTPPSRAAVAYSHTTNGGKVSGLGEKNGKNAIQILEFPSDTSAVEGEGVYFKIKVSGVPQPTVTWYHDGEPVKADYAREIEADGSLAIPSTELKHSGVYKAVVANQQGSEEREVKLTVNDEGGATPSAAAADDVVSSRPISIPEFGQYVSNLHAQSNQPFRDLFQVLDSGETGRSTNYAVDPERKNYNRFGNIVVYDDNRIPLQPLPDHPDCQEDYINACYVDGYSVPQKFIATQGPLPKTVVHFWQLIWQERPPTIVMVTNVKEGNRIKCQQYWPDSGKKEFGPFQVTITDQQVFADYAIRTLSVSLGSGRSHKVTQYHFTAWPDHGVPDYATPILAFHRRVKSQHHPSRGPMVVHCSAGVGRTGTFIVIDHILEQIEKEQVVDIPGAITKIRQKRMKMVQSVEQFTFIHDAILESVTCGDTQIAATNLRVAIGKMSKKDRLSQLNVFQTQFKILEQVSTKPEEVKCNQALTFPKRNRGNDYLPADRWRVILKGEQPDYIHAVNINGYKQQKAFIIAQGPMDSTVRNFWKMIYDRKCAVVVMVSDLVERGTECSVRYWPSSGMYSYGEYTVDLLGEEPLEGFTIRELSVMEGKSGKAHKVTQFHITCWSPDGRCSNLKSITDVIEEMTKVQIRSGNKPIVVHCNDTVTRSGMFCAIATTIERCKTEGVVDVFQVVKALRVQKPGAVPNVENFKLLFDVILVYLESFDTYANFQNI